MIGSQDSTPLPRALAPQLAALTSAVLLFLSLQSGCGPKGGGAVGLLPDDVAAALGQLPDAKVLALGKDLLPTFIHGMLGKGPPRLDAGKADEALAPAMDPITPVFRLQYRDLTLLQAWTDPQGYAHARYQQHFQGLEVVGGDLTVHMNPRGELYAVHGTARGTEALDTVPRLDSQQALTMIAQESVLTLASLETATLVVKETSKDQQLHLAWESAGVDAEGVRHQLYLDAHSGELIADEPSQLSFLARTVSDAQGQWVIPGKQVRLEDDPPTGDPIADAAFQNLGRTWLCYHDAFGRDSVDGKGMSLEATVHYGEAYANAFWNGVDRRMVFGDGDGEELGPTSEASDVVSHELTHGVVEHSAALIYQGECGALNEGFADIMAAYCDARVKGKADAATYLVGEDIWTPAEPDDALRYMNDPEKDGNSLGWWPNRMTGYWDHGGVHLNSGIANLAFYLLSEGGVNPEGHDTARVPGIGIERAGAIFYRALTQYLTSHADFAGARAATVRAALDLEGPDTAAIVNLAWDAVGVPTPELPRGPDTRVEACDDRVDNNDNGYIDCADPACADTGRCGARYENGEGGLMISELMANPLLGPDPHGEWFELYNWTTKPIDLAGYTLSSPLGAPHRIARSVVVPARGFVTLAYEATPGLGFTPDYIYGPSQLRLGNRRDELFVYDRLNNQVAHLDWGLLSSQGGRPEAGRSLVAQGAWYEAEGPSWSQSLSGAYNAAGDQGSPGQASAPGAEQTARFGDLHITELFIDPAGSEPAGEWIELQAMNWRRIRLDGLTLSSGSQSTTLVAPGVVLEAGERVVLCRDPSLGPAGCLGYDAVRLNNQEGVVTVSAGPLSIDELSYRFGPSNPAPPEGSSLEVDEEQLGWQRSSDATCASVTPWRDGMASPGSAGRCHHVLMGSGG